ESEKGEGVEVVKNEPHEDPVHGAGQFTENKLPSWARAVTPRIFYITEKAWNYYPYTITGETTGGRLAPQCSFLPKFSIYIETKYEDNCGDSENKILGDHEVSFLDIAFDEIPERYYRSLEDPRYFSSAKTGRGPLREGWRQHTQPIMCSYKLVTVKFEVWGLQSRVEQFVHKVIRDVLLIGHRQAFAWVDEWCGECGAAPLPAPAMLAAGRRWPTAGSCSAHPGWRPASLPAAPAWRTSPPSPSRPAPAWSRSPWGRGCLLGAEARWLSAAPLQAAVPGPTETDLSRHPRVQRDALEQWDEEAPRRRSRLSCSRGGLGPPPSPA
uniref:Phosphatidylinositol transfer protein N-terminal domain-containing protein n=1 Tax=Dromaius novaehollandiae TaxID=8790 RepID=A0A8C4JJK2_DRONO